MSKLATENAHDADAAADAAPSDDLAGDPAAIRPVPRISIQAFCESRDVAASLETSFADRRMARAHSKVHMGGIQAATDFYGNAPTPNVVILETLQSGDLLLGELEGLSEVCDPGTKVIVIGHHNDVQLYRELIRRGISEYTVAPVDLFDLLRTLSELFYEPETGPLGRTVAFVGAKGGVGASTLAHNVGWSIARMFESDVVIADLDLPFGTAGLDFNVDPPQGLAEAIYASDRIDDTFLDRLLSKCTDKLNLLAAPATLDRTYDLSEAEFDQVIEIVQASVPAVILDVPHVWNGWTRRTLVTADEVVLVAAPDLANLRNAKNMIDCLRQERPNDAPPRLVLNQIGIPKRPEIKPAEFADALNMEPVATIGFDPQLFGLASNNGQMIAETNAKSEAAASIDALSQVVTGRVEPRSRKKSAIAPLIARLRGKATG